MTYHAILTYHVPPKRDQFKGKVHLPIDFQGLFWGSNSEEFLMAISADLKFQASFQNVVIFRQIYWASKHLSKKPIRKPGVGLIEVCVGGEILDVKTEV